MKYLRPLKSGDPLSLGPHSAGAWSELVDVAGYVDRLRQVGPNRIHKPLFADRTMVMVQNTTASPCNRFDVLAVTGSVIDPTSAENAFCSRVCLEGYTPDTPDNYGRFVIVAQPIAAGGIGWAWASGICVVQVDYDYAEQPYADIKDGDSGLLAADEGGAAQVIWKEAEDTGVLWSVVRLGVPHYPILRGKLDGDLTKATGYATMSVWEGSTLADSGRNVTVYDPGALSSGKKIASGSGLSASWTSGKWWLLTPYVCES